MKKNTISKKLTKKEVAKIVKSVSRKHKIPPNKVEDNPKVYKREKNVDPDQS